MTGDAPIHSIVKMKKKNHTEFLFALLINTTVLVDLENRKKKTALLLALEVSILLHCPNVSTSLQCVTSIYAKVLYTPP